MDPILDTAATRINDLIAESTNHAATAAAPSTVPTETPHASADAAPLSAQAPPSDVTGLRKHPIPAVLRPWTRDSGDVHRFLHDDLAKSGLTAEDVPAWFAVGGSGIGRYCRFSSDTPSGYAIAYFDLDGSPVQDTGSDFVRFRLMAPLVQALDKNGAIKSQGKYVSAKDSASHIYIPVLTAELLRDPTTGADAPLVITEGEKKAEALVKHTGIPCVALAGIHMWFDPEADKREAIAQRALHPELNAVIAAYADWVSGKPVVLVLYDSDGRPGKQSDGRVEVKDGRKSVWVRNVDVYSSARTLAARVYATSGMRIATSAAWCPDGPHGSKQGLDDWLVARGTEEVQSTIQALAANPTHKLLGSSDTPALVLSANLDRDVAALTDCLERHPDLYLVGGVPAIIEPSSTAIDLIDHEGLLAREVSKVAQPYVLGDEGKAKPCYLPPRIAHTLLRSPLHRSGLRRVDAVSAQPVPKLLDGEPYVTGEGYDEDTKILGAFADEEWDIPVRPTFAEFVEACETIGELINELYLETPADVSAMIAALLTAVARPGLPTAPAFLISAPDSGAGKGYIAQVISMLTASHPSEAADVMTLITGGNASSAGNAEAEFSKMVLGALTSPRPVLQFDEVEGDKIDGKALRTLLTSEVFSGRRLGTNAMVSLPTRKLILVTASNVEPSMDSVRRFITIRITPPADPAKRNQSADNGAAERLRANRVTYARAAIVVAFGGMHLLRDSPNRMPIGIPLLGTYTEWSRVVAGPATLAAWILIKRETEPVNLVECDDAVLSAIANKNPLRDAIEAINPMLRQTQTKDADPARLALRDLLDAMYRFQIDKCGGKPWKSAQLVTELREQRLASERYKRDSYTETTPEMFALYTELSSAGLRDDQMVASTKLGIALHKYRDREIGGMKLVAGRSNSNTATWQVIKS